MSYGTIAALIVIGLIALLSHFLPKIRYQKCVDQRLPKPLIKTSCPHCGHMNGLTFMDLAKSFYMGNTHDNLRARHWCHSCHKGCDRRLMGIFSLCGWLLVISALSFIFFNRYITRTNFNFLQSTNLSDQLLAFAFVISTFAMLFSFDFFINVLNLKLLGYKKQT